MMGHRANQQVRQRPKKPIISDFEKTPKNIPIYLYQPEWFNEKNHSEKLVAADLSEVAFVPVKNLPPGSKEHPDKRLGDISFNYKYWESTIKDYEINPRTPDESESQSVGSSLDDNSIDLNAATGERDVDNNLLEKEIIESGKGETKLLEEENNVAIKNCEDVVMLDAWDSRLARGNWRMNNYYDDVQK
ncbi:hypothetical protein O181_117635 [Austropuccinia psidii MF-1]|uniref:Uncharacterized protein n=1 Tax=Austropuccinia psidii MF-1 TaxID=1389203 RepID=A0A9Q3KAQ5_9BASI|nr:hypothetical protein [Austropuccinia psidii MF-1]